MGDVRKWSSYVLLLLFAVWLVQWAVKLFTGQLLDAFDFTRPSIMSALGIGALLAFLLARGTDPKRPWPYLVCLAVVGVAVAAALLLRAVRLVMQPELPPWIYSVLDLSTPLPGSLPITGPVAIGLFFILELVMAALVVRRVLLFKRAGSYAPPVSFSSLPFMAALLFLAVAAVWGVSLVGGVLLDGYAQVPETTPLFLLPLLVAFVEVLSWLRREA